jgi:hypothetical protein
MLIIYYDCSEAGNSLTTHAFVIKATTTGYTFHDPNENEPYDFTSTKDVSKILNEFFKYALHARALAVKASNLPKG